MRVDPSWMRVVPLREQTWESFVPFLSFYYVRIQQENSHLRTRKWTLIRYLDLPPLSSYFPTSRTVRNKCLLFILPSLWYSFFFSMFLFLRERERVWVGRGREREREIQNLKQIPVSELSPQNTTWGPNSLMGRSWPEPKLDT